MASGTGSSEESTNVPYEMNDVQQLNATALSLTASVEAFNSALRSKVKVEITEEFRKGAEGYIYAHATIKQTYDRVPTLNLKGESYCYFWQKLN